MKNWRLYLLLILSISACKTQEINLTSFAVDQKWEKKIYRLAPSSTVAPITKKHKVLLFSLHTGFEHWVIPHADVVIQTLAHKTGAYSVSHIQGYKNVSSR